MNIESVCLHNFERPVFEGGGGRFESGLVVNM